MSPSAKLRARFGPGGQVMRALAESWAAPRLERVPVPLPRIGAPSPELAAWAALFETLELETADPGEAELRAPGDLAGLGETLGAALTESGPLADVVAALTASTVVVEQDELAYLASWSGTASGHSKVYVFHPDDWGLHLVEPTLSVCLLTLELSARRMALPFPAPLRLQPVDDDLFELAPVAEIRAETSAEPLPRHLEPGALARRVDWVLKVLAGRPPAAPFKAEPLSQFEAELELLQDHPHLALQWLFAHALLDNGRAFAAAWSASAGSGDPWVKEARAVLRRWMEGRTGRLGPYRQSDFRTLQEASRLFAPEAALETPFQAPPVARARSELLGRDPSAEVFVALFDHLESGAEPEPFEDLSPDELEARLAALTPVGAKPLLEAALAESAGLPDHHPRAGRGRILALATLCPDLTALDAALDAAGGNHRFGPRRRDEHWRAVARFEGDEAAARLAHGAGRFADEAEDWIRTASKVPWDALLDRDRLETHELVSRFLLAVPHTPMTAPLVVEAVAAAQRHRIARAVPGLRRAVAGGVGRLDDGSRAEVAWTVTELDAEAGPFLGAVARLLRVEWEEAEDEEEAQRRAFALAQIAGPWLAVGPEDLEARAAVAALVARFIPRFGAGGKPPDAPLLESLRALTEGIHAGDVGALMPALRALPKLEPQIHRVDAAAYLRLAEALAKLR